jgi:hypothetical protein
VKTSSLARLTRLLGPIAVAWYLLFTALAWISYPGAYGPWNNNWLSDLGNRQLNPAGAEFYAAACVGTGILVGGFFVGLASWRGSGPKVQDWLLLVVQVAGLIGALSIVMTAVFSIDQFAAHQFWSRMVSGSMAVSLFVSPFALWRPARHAWLLGTVSAVGYLLVIARLVFASAHWLEWPSIGFLLLYVLVVASITHGAGRQRQDRLASPGSATTVT